MKRRFWLYTVLALASVALISCKKDEETVETKPGLHGLAFDLATFARVGESFTMKPYGLYTSDGKDLPELIIYKWKVNSGTYAPSDVFELKNVEVGNYTVTCQAVDSLANYYSTTATRTLIVIDPLWGRTLVGTGIESTDDHITDQRDNDGENDYFYKKVGDLEWFRNNLAYTGAGVPYEMGEVTSYPLGRYYTWEEAKDACPEGWRLPTDEEWAALGTEAGPLTADAFLNDKRMWDYWPGVERTNTTGLAIIPAGYVLAGVKPSFKRIYDYAAFWTATENEENPSLARYRYMYVKDNDVKATWGDKQSLALSVRCVR